jgi:predicted deacylase
MTRTTPFTFAGQSVSPGRRRHVDLPVGRLPSGTEVALPIEVVHGSRPGPTIWLSGALHGDEIVGVEIIRRVLEQIHERELCGTVVAVPIVNVFGFVTGSRYLPDRRDLNRSFPGTARGPLAGRLARQFVDNVVSVSDIGIDFHAGSDDRTNLPQIRGNMLDAETQRLARAFGAPLLVHSGTIKGSLRETALKRGKRILLFEGGEPRRFNPEAVQAGAEGTMRVLHALGMTTGAPPSPSVPPAESRSTKWVRAPKGGIFRLETFLGARVDSSDRLGVITDPAGRSPRDVLAGTSGLVMGHAVNPLVHQGDAIVHVAELG